MVRLGEFSPEERAFIAWGLTVIGCYELPEVFTAMVGQSSWASWAQDKEQRGGCQAALWHAYHADLALRLEANLEVLSEEARKACKDAAVEQQRRVQVTA